MNAEEFDACLSRLFDGELPPGEFEALEQHLISDAHARRQYLDYVDLHNILELEFSAPFLSGAGNQAFAPVSRILRRQRIRVARISALATAALLMVGVLVFALVSAKNRASMAGFRLAPGTVFNLTHPEGTAPESAELVEGSRLVLDHGTVELTLPTGVRAIVTAPADIVYDSEDLIRLDEGTGWFRVPSSASGFQIRTEELLVTDLGTEFGIISHVDLPDEAHLLGGKISVRNLSGNSPERMLEGGGALKVSDGGDFEEIESRPEDFKSSLPSMPPYLHLSFDNEEGGRFPVEGTATGTSEIRAEMVSGTPQIVPGISGGALRLKGDGSYLETDWDGISGAWPRSVACWVRLDVKRDRMIPGIAGWGLKGDHNTKWKVGAGMLKADESLISRVSFGRHWFDGTVELKEGTWHHLVFIYHGRLLENGLPDVAIHLDGQKIGLLYQGGKDTATAPGGIDTETNSRRSHPLLIGKSPGDQVTFSGDIDDLYIFTGALQDEVIQELFNKGRPD